MIDCGHVCCEQRSNGAHVHAVEPDDCQVCALVNQTGEIPAVSIDQPITTEVATREDHHDV